MDERSQRRHHRERLRDRVRQWTARWLRWRWWTPEALDAYVRKHAETPHPCSCPLCGNRRKYFGEKTLQERRAEQPEEQE